MSFGNIRLKLGKVQVDKFEKLNFGRNGRNLEEEKQKVYVQKPHF